MSKMIKLRSVNILLAVGLIFCMVGPLLFSTPVEAVSIYTKEGDSVYTNSNDTYIRVTPHTLTSSGWVTVNFSTSKFTDDVDISFGFNGLDQVKTIKSESWEVYDKSDGKGGTQTVTDWKTSNTQITKENKDYQGAKKWDSVKYSQKVVKDQLYSTRFWVDLPFSGLNKVSGKYNVAIKPSNLTMEQAVTQNKIAILDPWYDSGWGYRKQFTVTGSTAGAQINYQMKFNILYGSGADYTGLNNEPSTGTYIMDATTSTTSVVDSQLTGTTNGYYIGCVLFNVTRMLSSNVTASTVVAGVNTLTISPAIAAQVATDTYYITGRIPTIATDSKCKTDFSDIRFTKADGITLLDSWLETYLTSSNATVWVELDSIPAAPTTTTFYIYYGNAGATSSWSGNNTFIFFDDFERGLDGDPVGGSWTSANCTISTDHPYAGTRGGKVVGSIGAYQNNMYATVTASNNIAIGFKFWKEGAMAFNFEHGNGIKEMAEIINTTEDISYYNAVVALIDTTYNVIADLWKSFGYRNINWGAFTYDTTYDNAIINIPQMGTLAGAVNQIWLRESGAAGVGNDLYVDNVIVRNYCSPEPLITAYGAIEITGGAAEVLKINNAKVFNSYLEADDWLITLLYLNKYEPYYTKADDVASLFYIQLYNVADTVLLAQTKCPEWGYKPGCIYLSALQASSLEWGLSYKVKVYGDFSGNPVATYTLNATDWLGADLTRLDSWVRSTARLMEIYETSLLPTSTYYTANPVVYTSFLAGKGLVLNQDGGAIFDTCIPKLSFVRPGIFQIVTVTPPYTHGTFTQTYQQTLIWQTLLGPHLTATFTNLGDQFNVPSNVVGSSLGFVFYAVVAIFCFPAGSAIAAISIPSVVLLIIWFTGLLPLASLGFIMAGLAFILLWSFWLKGG